MSKLKQRLLSPRTGMKKPEDKILFEGLVLWGFMQKWKLHVAKGFQITYISMDSRG